MTTIAYRHGLMAADKQAWLGRFESKHATKSKIYIHERMLIGVSSSVVGAGDWLFNWFVGGCDPKAERPPEQFEFMAVNPDGCIAYANTALLLSHIEAPYFAIGSGNAYAHGAMAMGASAEEAVHTASLFDPFTGGFVDTMRHPT